MALADDLQRIILAKQAMKAAIEEKGVTVPSEATISAYANLIRSIDQNENALATGTVTPAQATSEWAIDVGQSANTYSHFLIFPLNYGETHAARAVGLQFVDFNQGYRLSAYGSATDALVNYASAYLLDVSGTYPVTRNGDVITLAMSQGQTGNIIAGTTYRWYAW